MDASIVNPTFSPSFAGAFPQVTEEIPTYITHLYNRVEEILETSI